MTLKEDPSSLKERLSDFAGHFDETGHKGADRRHPSGKKGLLKSIFHDLRDLLPQDVTREGLRDLIRRDARDAFRFTPVTSIWSRSSALPRYRRYPAMAWKVFVALAYRLSPPRRIAFALAVFMGVIGWIRLLAFSARWGPPREDSGAFLLFISFSILLLLLTDRVAR